jgi:hypothetical protein
MNKRRSAAYRVLVSGSRYHAGKVSGLTLGQRRGSLKDLRRDFEELRRRIKRQEKCNRIEYFGTYVRDFKDEAWRRHAHIVWTSPITDWQWLKETYEKIAKEQSSIYIDNRIEESRYKLGYCLQYNANQKGESVRYAKSDGWLPQGYHEAWKSIREKEDSSYATWILDMNAWIDLQRAIKQDTSVQTELMHIECDINDAALQVPGTDRTRAHAFVKRAI